MAILHHEFYTFLHGRPVNGTFGSHAQAIVSGLKNSIAYIGHLSLAAAITGAFVQVLWWRFRTRRQGHSIHRINALISCQNSPFTPSSFPAWSISTFSLVFIAALANLTAFITIWAPGALSIIPGEQPEPCTILVPDLPAVPLGGSSAISFASRAVIQGYLPPFRQCNQTCHFNVEYLAPALNCTNTTDSIDFATLLPTDILWKSSYTSGSNGLVIQAAMVTNVDKGQMSAVECTAYNATYLARMDHSNISSTITLLDEPERHNPLTTTIPDPTTDGGHTALGALAGAMAYTINGSIDASHGLIPAGSSIIQYTRVLFDAYHWNQTQDLMWMLPSLMENVSLSLPSGLLDQEIYPPTNVPRNTTCYYSVNVYAYNSSHLLLPYGSCVVVSLICSLLAIFAIRRDGDEFLDFARILEAIPSQGLTLSHLTEEDCLRVGEKDRLFEVVDPRPMSHTAWDISWRGRYRRVDEDIPLNNTRQSPQRYDAEK